MSKVRLLYRFMFEK